MIEGTNDVLVTCLDCDACHLTAMRAYGGPSLDALTHLWCLHCSHWTKFHVSEDPSFLAAYRLGGPKAVKEMIDGG